MNNYDEALNHLELQQKICTGPIWESITKHLDKEYGPKNIIAGITHYAMLEQTDTNLETIPRQLDLQELTQIIKKTTYNHKITQEDLLNHTYTALNEIFDNPDKYQMLIYCTGTQRPLRKELKEALCK